MTHAEMAQALDSHLAQFKIPQHLWVQHEPLARGTTDKIDRRSLRAVCLENGDNKA